MYTDPDGREDFWGSWLMDWYSNNDMAPTQQDVFDAGMNYCEQQFANGMQVVQNELSSAMEKTMDVAGNAIVASAEFMSEYGGAIAIACYASGNIGLGIIIDGVSLACDISLTANKLVNNDISGQQAAMDIASTCAATAIGSKCGSNFTKAATRTILDSNTEKIISNCIADFVSQGFTITVDIQKNQ